jgi:hypothetical protein
MSRINKKKRKGKKKGYTLTVEFYFGDMDDEFEENFKLDTEEEVVDLYDMFNKYYYNSPTEEEAVEMERGGYQWSQKWTTNEYATVNKISIVYHDDAGTEYDITIKDK